MSPSPKDRLTGFLATYFLDFESRGYSKSEAEKKIWEAFFFAERCHAGQYRESGEPYISHPVEALGELVHISPDVTSLIAMLLHDTLETKKTSLHEIREVFGGEVAHIVESVENIGKMKYRGRQDSIQSLQKTFLALSQDVRSVLVKFADRIHNLKTLHYKSNPLKQKRVAEESLQIYAPIASRLGIFRFKEALEDESFRSLYPEAYLKIKGEIANMSEDLHTFFTHSIFQINKLLEGKMPYDVTYRIKQPYSIYRKMLSHKVDHIRDLYDTFALRIITDSIEHCYAILGIIHGAWKPMDGRFKDYIAAPKPNGYQSLHTTVIGLYDKHQKKPCEIQIRTKEMEEYADFGFAAHHAYKSGEKNFHLEEEWIRDLKDSLEDLLETNDEEKIPLRKNDEQIIFVFTPKGDVIELPRQATPIDFAYTIHSDVGDRTTGCKINGKMSPLDSKLSSGDVVEVITAQNTRPSLTWLEFVRSSRARTHISNAIKKYNGDRERIIERGKVILDSYLELHFGKGFDENLSQIDYIDGGYLDTKKKEELLYMVGNMIRKPASVFKDHLHRKYQSNKTNQKLQPFIPKTEEQSTDIMVSGQKGLPFRIAKCCMPKTLDEIVAIVKRGGELSIHKKNCELLAKSNPQRRMSAYWQYTSGTLLRRKLTLLFLDQKGTLSKLTQSLFQMGVNIVELESHPKDDLHSEVSLIIDIPRGDFDYIRHIQERLTSQIDEFIGVIQVD